MEDGSSNGTTQPWLPHNPKDERKKYRSLKRKFRLLEEENADLSEEVVRSRRLISRLQNERTFILDRLLKLERFHRTSDTDTDSGPGSSDSEIEEDSGKRKEANGNGISPSAKRPKSVPNLSAQPASIINVDPESLGLCVAVVRDRPCKSKALSGYRYCWHHAPLDPNSPFIWCQFRGTSSKNKKCSIPVLKTKDPPYCKYHSNEKDEAKDKDKEKEKEKETDKSATDTKDKDKEKEKDDSKDKEKEKEKEKDKSKKKDKKDKHKKKKKDKHKKRSKDKKTDKIKEEVKALKLQLKGLEGEELRLNGVGGEKPIVEDDTLSGSDSSRLTIQEEVEDDSDEGMTIVEVEDDEIHLI